MECWSIGKQETEELQSLLEGYHTASDKDTSIKPLKEINMWVN